MMNNFTRNKKLTEAAKRINLPMKNRRASHFSQSHVFNKILFKYYNTNNSESLKIERP